MVEEAGGNTVSKANEIYNELIAPIERRMMSSVTRIVRNPEDAADTLQNALTSIWKNLKKIHHHPNPHAYILRVCVNAAYDTLRKRRRRNEQPLDEMEGSIPSHGGSESPAIALVREREVLSAIASLPRNQAEAVLLRVVEDQPFQSIAEALGCREETARSHVSKGKARLREILAGTL